jgi:hypothetical protein
VLGSGVQEARGVRGVREVRGVQEVRGARGALEVGCVGGFVVIRSLWIGSWEARGFRKCGKCGGFGVIGGLGGLGGSEARGFRVIGNLQAGLGSREARGIWRDR